MRKRKPFIDGGRYLAKKWSAVGIESGLTGALVNTRNLQSNMSFIAACGWLFLFHKLNVLWDGFEMKIWKYLLA